MFHSKFKAVGQKSFCILAQRSFGEWHNDLSPLQRWDCVGVLSHIGIWGTMLMKIPLHSF